MKLRGIASLSGAKSRCVDAQTVHAHRNPAVAFFPATGTSKRPTLHPRYRACRSRAYQGLPVRSTENQLSTLYNATVAGLPPPAEVVDEILEAVKGTDAGAAASPELRECIDANLALLEQHGLHQGNPLRNPNIYGDFDVAYVSSSESSPPAGGLFRSTLGKTLFRTARLCQSVLQPDLAVNKVEFLLCGLVPGYVGLRGKLTPLQDDQRTVRVQFEPPVLRLGGLVLRIGPPSSVVLTTTYLDERVRLGKGSRGSLFVFTRGGSCGAACMDQVGLEQSSPWSVAAALALVAGIGTAAVALLMGPGPLQQALGAVLGALLLGVLYTVWRGGQARDNT